MYRHQKVLFGMMLFAVVASAQAKNWVSGGKTMSCADAVKYRDNELFAEFASAVGNFDGDRETRIKKTLDAMEGHIKALTKELETQDQILTKRLATVVAGLVMAKTGSYLATKGKTGISDIEKKTLEALADRSAAWNTFFLKLGTDKGFKPEAADVIQIPVGFAASFFPPAALTWTVGTATIDVASAIAEQQIAKKDAKVSAESLRAGVKSIAEKLRMPKVSELNAVKTSIDSQCN